MVNDQIGLRKQNLKNIYGYGSYSIWKITEKNALHQNMVSPLVPAACFPTLRICDMFFASNSNWLIVLFTVVVTCYD